VKRGSARTVCGECFLRLFLESVFLDSFSSVSAGLLDLWCLTTSSGKLWSESWSEVVHEPAFERAREKSKMALTRARS